MTLPRNPSGAGSPGTTYNLLFVCTGNTCRSAMAEAIARREIERRGWHHVAVRSAGTAAVPGAPASAGAVTAGRSAGLDLLDHAAARVGPQLVAWADVALAMGPAHLEVIRSQGGAGKSALLGDFAAGSEGGGEPVADPYGGDDATYQATFVQLVGLVEATLDRLAPILQP